MHRASLRVDFGSVSAIAFPPRRAPGNRDGSPEFEKATMRSFCFAASTYLRTAAGVVALSIASLIGPAALATPIVLQTPTGLNPGDNFRFLFLTSGTQSATSADISVYNTFVTNQAFGATYQGSVVSWQAVASTATVNARDNVGGFNTNVPVYLTNGTLLAGDLTTGTANKGLWSGSLFTTPIIGIDESSVSTRFAYTGSQADGTGNSGKQLGTSTAQYGDPTFNIGTLGWYFSINGLSSGVALNFYGVSSELTVPSAVPEIDPAGASSVMALVAGALGLLERRARRMLA